MTTNERLAVQDGWNPYGSGGFVQTMPGSFKKMSAGPPDILNDWNALKRLKKKAIEKGGYTDALMSACGIEWTTVGQLECVVNFNVSTLIAATPEQVAEAILAVLE